MPADFSVICLSESKSATKLWPAHQATAAHPISILAVAGSLAAHWASYAAAATDAIRSEALRGVELEAENAALQRRMRQMVQQLHQAKQQLRTADKDPGGVQLWPCWSILLALAAGCSAPWETIAKESCTDGCVHDLAYPSGGVCCGMTARCSAGHPQHLLHVAQWASQGTLIIACAGQPCCHLSLGLGKVQVKRCQD